MWMESWLSMMVSLAIQGCSLVKLHATRSVDYSEHFCWGEGEDSDDNQIRMSLVLLIELLESHLQMMN
jgi:hypothetical protein